MPRIEEIERRLLNWARWSTGRGGGLGFSGASSWMRGLGTRGRYREATIPTVDCEAEETDRAVKALDVKLRDAIESFYTSSIGVHCQAKNMQITVSALYARIYEAHAQLQRAFLVKGEIAAEQRRQIEVLQDAARPKG